MKRDRVPETDHGITGTVEVSAYDEMQRGLRDKGWIETDAVIKSGITGGHALEIGHGPGYLGLEWLKKTKGTRLTGLDISPDMTRLAEGNARKYGVQERVDYRGGEGNRLPFDDASFDAVFTNGSLHEWVDPEGTFDEIHRVLKPGGRFFISDLRRDMPLWARWFLWFGCQPAFIRPYLFSSIDASYTCEELRAMVARTRLKGAAVTGNMVGSEITGSKTA